MAKQGAMAKISTPRLFGVVGRRRLFAQLDQNAGRPLLWIDGPPGAGKTTLVASYLEARRIPTLWYQVEPNDADPANLFHFLTLGAEAFSDADARPLPKLVPEHLSDLSAFARTFFRQLFARLPTDVVIVLDNYQEAPAEALLHEVVRTAVAEVPTGSSIYCVSRTEAPPSFAQLLATGALFGLHWDMLQLTLDETREIAAARDIQEDWLVRAIHQQSEGWAAGVTLMLERVGHATSEMGVLPADTREAVFNYFASLLFDRAPETTRHTLSCISFLPHVTGSMARRMSGREDAGEVLDQFYRRHLFTDRRPGTEPFYQFHALFRDFLQTRVSRDLNPRELERLKLSSAQALQVSGDVDAAMGLWIATEHWEEAVCTILEAANALLGSGRRQTLERWISALPAAVQEGQPWIAYWLGMARVQIAPESGIETLRKALERFRASGDVRGVVICITALLNAAFLGYLAVDSMDSWLDGLLREVENVQSFASSDVELKFWGALCSALFWSRPWHPWAADVAHRVEALLAYQNDPNVALAAASSALATTALSGDFDCGDRIALATEHLVDSPSASPSEAAWWLNRAGYLRFLEARYEEALEFLHRACQVAEANGMRTMLATTIYHRFMVEFRVSGWAVANTTLSQMEAMPRPTYPVAEAMLYVYQARRAQFRGRRDEAADLAELTHAAILRTRSQYQEMLFGLVDAELLLDAGRIEKARPMIVRSRELIERAPVFDCFRAALVFDEARLAQIEGNLALAFTRLRGSLSLAKERNRKYFLRYLECAMPHLFTLALDEGIEAELVQQLIRMFRLKPPAGAPDLWPWPVRIRTLGGFEVLVNDGPLEFSRKVPKKTLALLKVLVAYGGQEVSEQSICDALWGDEEADAAKQALGITVVRLRKLLGVTDAVLQQGGKVSLDRMQCWVDAWQSNEPGTVSKGLALYGGTFLPEDEGEAWSVPARERLRGKFIHLLATHGRSLEAGGDTAGAIDLYLRGVDADPIVEVFHQGLMRCYQALGRHTEAISAYRRLRQTLSVVLGVAPSPESQALYRGILGTCAERVEATDSQSVILLPANAQRRRDRGVR
ncbi:MAG TPA: BTAD domain-containing putative transcriptional regulator [Burkholderiales bacterium]|nr:BTAD domain-containing putative transcriptional regulator [Burkholderiales bacterium]